MPQLVADNTLDWAIASPMLFPPKIAFAAALEAVATNVELRLPLSNMALPSEFLSVAN